MLSIKKVVFISFLKGKNLLRLCVECLVDNTSPLEDVSYEWKYVNPIPIKEAMNMMGMEVGSCRLPLAQIQPQAKEKLRRSLSALGMI